MRVLAITKIFPNAVEPLSAPFNRQQFAALARYCELHVMATLPWFPGARWAGQSAARALRAVPPRETIAGLPVFHPRTLYLPRIAHASWGPLYAASIAPLLHRWRNNVDVVLGSWAYPDGFAAILAARMLGVPAVVKVHGSDINSLPQLPGPRRLLQWALPQAAAVVAVSQPLADGVAALGVARDRIALVRNGVDSDVFFPGDRAKARRELQLPTDGPLAIYVGNLKASKGVLDLLNAAPAVLARVPDATLAIVGGGEAEATLRAQLATLAQRAPRLAEQVRVIGPVAHAAVAQWMAACDILVLPSWAEGTPNVVLEALASGRRVVATAVGGIPDLITAPALGTLVPARDPEALGRAISEALVTAYEPAAIAASAAAGSWDASAQQLHRVLTQAVQARLIPFRRRRGA